MTASANGTLFLPIKIYVFYFFVDNVWVETSNKSRGLGFIDNNQSCNIAKVYAHRISFATLYMLFSL